MIHFDHKVIFIAPPGSGLDELTHARGENRAIRQGKNVQVRLDGRVNRKGPRDPTDRDISASGSLVDDGGDAGKTQTLSQPLIVPKEERVVLPNGSAQTEAELISL